MASAANVQLQFGSYIPTVPTIPALRNVSVAGLSADAVVMVLGAAGAGDGNGGVYAYRPTSIANDDGSTVIKPVIASASGRWLKCF